MGSGLLVKCVEVEEEPSGPVVSGRNCESGLLTRSVVGEFCGEQ